MDLPYVHEISNSRQALALIDFAILQLVRFGHILQSQHRFPFSCCLDSTWPTSLFFAAIYLQPAQLGTHQTVTSHHLPHHSRKVASFKVLGRAKKWLASEDGLPDGCLHFRWDEQITSSPALQQCMLSLDVLETPNGEANPTVRVLWNVADRCASRQQCPPSPPSCDSPNLSRSQASIRVQCTLLIPRPGVSSEHHSS